MVEGGLLISNYILTKLNNLKIEINYIKVKINPRLG